MNVWGSLEWGVTHSHDTSASVSIATVTVESDILKWGRFHSATYNIPSMDNNYAAVTADDGQNSSHTLPLRSA